MSRTPFFLLCLLVISCVDAEFVDGEVDDVDYMMLSRTLIERDEFGVERTFKLFTKHPELERRIRRDLWADRVIDPLDKAIALNNEDLLVNPLLKNAWDLGHQMRPEYASDPLKMAAFVYSLSDPSFNPIYQEFNDAIAAYTNNSSYADFHYKGMYALLALSVRPYQQVLFRGISATMAAENGMFMRFNRFQSTSTNLTAAMIYATKRGVPGTLLIFNGVKNAAHIDPYSYYPDEDEYLVEPQSQFRVSEIVDGPMTETNPGRTVVLEPAFYP